MEGADTQRSHFRICPIARRAITSTPERRLALAVLEEGLMTFQKHHAAADVEGVWAFRQAEHWIMSSDDDRSFSFAFLCEAVGLDPDWVRRELRRWQATEPAGPASSGPRSRLGR